jgi:hypothetical protein
MTVVSWNIQHAKQEKEMLRVLVEMIKSLRLILCSFNAPFYGTSNI